MNIQEKAEQYAREKLGNWCHIVHSAYEISQCTNGEISVNDYLAGYNEAMSQIKKFEIDFSGNVKCVIRSSSEGFIFEKGMDGWGDTIDANKYMEKVVELDKENESTFIRELFFTNLKETFAKHEKAGRLSPEAIESIKDWDKIEASFDAYIDSGETTIDYSNICVMHKTGVEFNVCYKEDGELLNAWMKLEFDRPCEFTAMDFGYIH